MGRYLDILNRAYGDECARDKSDKSDKTVISNTYGRQKVGLPCDQSPAFRNETGFCRNEASPSVAAKPLKNGFYRFGRFCRTFSELERRCPAYVDLDSWRQTVEDGRRFLSRWGEQAEALDWSCRDLFGLAPVPEKSSANYRRLGRYDETGLLWLLRGRPVVALTATTAAIQCPTGAIVTYRRHNKPALGPVGDNLKDLA
jgi:hypothetical protein